MLQGLGGESQNVVNAVTHWTCWSVAATCLMQAALFAHLNKNELVHFHIVIKAFCMDKYSYLFHSYIQTEIHLLTYALPFPPVYGQDCLPFIFVIETSQMYS